MGVFVPWPTGAAWLARRKPRYALDLRRRGDIAAAVDAYNRTHPTAPLPRNDGCRAETSISGVSLRRHRLRKIAGLEVSRRWQAACVRYRLRSAGYAAARYCLDPLLAEIRSLRWRQPKPLRTSRTDGYPGRSTIEDPFFHRIRRD